VLGNRVIAHNNSAFEVVIRARCLGFSREQDANMEEFQNAGASESRVLMQRSSLGVLSTHGILNAMRVTGGGHS